MVSGFFTSPCDHSRIFSGEASEIRIAENDSGSLGFSKKLKMSFIVMIVWLPTERGTLSLRNLSRPSLTAALIRSPPPGPGPARPAAAAAAPTLAATSRAISSRVDSCLRGAFGSSMSSTLRQSDCSSFRSTLNDSGRPDSSLCSPLTIASYMRVRPMTSSDFTVRNSCRP